MKFVNKFLLLAVAIAVDCVNARVVNKIEIRGNERIDIDTIRERLPVKEGDDIEAHDVNSMINVLYKSGLFDDVKIKFSGSKLKITIKEAPIINKISFEGNKKVKDEDILKNFSIKPKETLSPIKIKIIQTGLLQSYYAIGMYNVRVNPKIIKLPDNKVNLVFEINEDSTTKISQIVFYGNKHISSSELRGIISSQPYHWYRFMAQDDVYRPDQIEADKTMIVQHYKNNGFAQARVESVNADMSPDGHGLIISFKINEGKQFKFGNITINSNVKRISEKNFSKKPKCKKGQKFNATLVAVDISSMLQDLSKQGFSSINIEPHFEPDVSGREMNVRYDVKQGERKYISKIIVRGNDKTRDYAILKELLFEEGDVYNKTLISMSENNLRRTGFFSAVNIETIPDPIAPDKCIITVSVSEQKTGEIGFGGNYSTIDGPSLSFSYMERNFLGTGKMLNVSLSSSREQSGPSYQFKNAKLEKIERKKTFAFLNSVNIGVNDPHMFGRDMSGTLSIYKYTATPFDSFSVRNIGASVGVSYPIATGWTQSWELSSTRKLIDNVSKNISPMIKYQIVPIKNNMFALDQNLKFYQHKLTHVIGYSSHVYDGLLKGDYAASLSTSLFYNTNHHQMDLKNILTGTYLRPLGRSMILKLQASCGMLCSLGNATPNIVDSFTNSSTSVRGFGEHSIGARCLSFRGMQKKAKSDDKIYSLLLLDAAGAKKFFTGSTELSFPLNFASSLDVTGFVFVDMGYYWDPVSPKESDVLQKTNYSLDQLYSLREKKSKEKEKSFMLSDAGKPNGNENEIVQGRSGSKIYTAPKRFCKYESKDDEFTDSILIGHKVFNEKKIRLSVGFGLRVTLPFGPLEVSWGFPIRMGIFDSKDIFQINFGMKI